jgi:hypothetical protein
MQNGTSTNLGIDLTDTHLIHVTPDPGLAGLDGSDQWMLLFVEVLGCMLVLGRIAASHVSAG